MKRMIMAVCLMLVAAPYAMAQDKGKDADKAPVAAEKAAKPDASKGKGNATKSGKAKKEPSAKQKAQQEKMSSCSQEAKTQNMKGDSRKKFMKDCLKKS